MRPKRSSTNNGIGQTELKAEELFEIMLAGEGMQVPPGAVVEF